MEAWEGVAGFHETSMKSSNPHEAAGDDHKDLSKEDLLWMRVSYTI